MKLIEAPIKFEPQGHTYTLTTTGKQLSGITGTLLHFLFPHKYEGVSEQVLARKAAAGSKMHEDLQMIDSIGAEPQTPEGRLYLSKKCELNLKPLYNEFYVSDCKNFATAIDVIYDGEVYGTEGVVLADFKRTYAFDRESVAWQLSIGSYFLRLNNDVKVGKLLGIWFHNDEMEIIEVEPKSDEDVKRLINCYLTDTAFFNTDFIDEDELAEMAEWLKEMNDRYEQKKAEVLSKMQEQQMTSYKGNRLSISVITPAPREVFDTKKFREEHDDIYRTYLKQQITKPSIKITLK